MRPEDQFIINVLTCLMILGGFTVFATLFLGLVHLIEKVTDTYQQSKAEQYVDEMISILERLKDERVSTSTYNDCVKLLQKLREDIE